MEKKKNVGFGFRGTLLILFQAIGFFVHTAFTMWPMNILAGEEAGFFGGSGFIPKVYTASILASTVLQLIVSRYIGRVKNVKRMTIFAGAASLLLMIPIMTIPLTVGINIPWLLCYVPEIIIVYFYCPYAMGILIGQWFPRRKGTVMGITTCMFPLSNFLISIFSSRFFSSLANGATNALYAYWPFFLLALAGWLIGVIFIKDYPEMCGCYRDNDSSLSPEEAKAEMEREIREKRTTVWSPSHTVACRDFWLITLANGLLLMFAAGMMTQTKTIVYQVFPDSNSAYTLIMAMVCVAGLIGSCGLGLLDTHFGTRASMVLCAALMVAVGILGATGNGVAFVIAMAILGAFDGAASNFAVSLSAQYWRREDFPSVFAVVNPIAHIIESFGATLIATLLYNPNLGYTWDFRACMAAGVLAVILLLAFSPHHLKTVDDKYRLKAGKPLDDELVGRK
ncbi:MAG: MFS transporter [Oscillospiraceae bacterium]|nr:MFS transporter [Oscillospiraceae bacterium]